MFLLCRDAQAGRGEPALACAVTAVGGWRYKYIGTLYLARTGALDAGLVRVPVTAPHLVKFLGSGNFFSSCSFSLFFLEPSNTNTQSNFLPAHAQGLCRYGGQTRFA